MKNKGFYIGIAITIVIAISIVIACTWFISDNSKKNEYEAMTNLPSESWFEEDLEDWLLSRSITVTKMYHNYADTLTIVAKASYDNAVRTFHCQYKLKNYYITCWRWEYVRAVQI